MPGGQSDTSGAFPFPAQGGARGGTGGTGGGGGYEMVLALPGLDATSGGAGGGGGGSTGFTLIYTTSLVDDGVMASPALGP